MSQTSSFGDCCVELIVDDMGVPRASKIVPSVNQDCGCRSLLYNLRPSMPGRSFQFATRSRPLGS
jgi:hypothetical protein